MQELALRVTQEEAKLQSFSNASVTFLWTVRNSAVHDFGCLLQTLDNISSCFTTTFIRFPYVVFNIPFPFLVSGESGA
jgi:hypothetical protein